MFDTHAHVHDAAYDADRDEMLSRARAAGIDRILVIGTDLADSERALATAAQYGLDAAIGIHPHEAKEAPADVAAAFDALRARAPLAPRAIGECGLDYFYDHSPRERQGEVLEAQLAYATAHDLPVVFHQRDAFDDFVRVLERRWTPRSRGVVHCFTGTPDEAETLVSRFDLRLGIGGVLTFKNAAALREAVVRVGLDRLILETDCPYLAPVPLRGRRNEPAFVIEVVRVLASLFDRSEGEIAARTTATATALFAPARTAAANTGASPGV